RRSTMAFTSSSTAGRRAAIRRELKAGATSRRSLRCCGPYAVNMFSTATHRANGQVLTACSKPGQCARASLETSALVSSCLSRTGSETDHASTPRTSTRVATPRARRARCSAMWSVPEGSRTRGVCWDMTGLLGVGRERDGQGFQGPVERARAPGEFGGGTAEVRLRQCVEEVGDGRLRDEVGVRAGGAGVRSDAPRQMGAVARETGPGHTVGEGGVVVG